MGLLPVHAAGYHTEQPAAGTARRTVLDRVVSSYTPTVTALRHARGSVGSVSRQSGPDAELRALIVAMATTPGLPHGALRFVPEEARLLAARLPGAITLADHDTAQAPTLASVFAQMAVCPVAHFACHGISDPADPSRSRLLLQDHRDRPLTVSALSSAHLSHARLAYLSACDTALSSDVRLIDEAIHLASAFQLAGYPHVIGTLWAIDDHVAVQVADAFYAKIVNGRGLDAGQAAVALHEAIRAIRDALPATPSLWASQIHAGA